MSSPAGSSSSGRAASPVAATLGPGMPDRSCAAIGVGELLWDLLPDGPRLGGAPFNAIAHLARFGCRTAFVSAVGRDELGRRALAEVVRLGVATDLIGRVDVPTGVVRVAIDESGAPAYEIVSPAAYEAIEPPGAPGRERAPLADLVAFGTLAQRFAAVRRMTRWIVAANPGSVRLYDVNLRPGCWTVDLVAELLGEATVAKFNEDEVATLAAAYHLPTGSTERFARSAAERFALRGVCVTRGASGAALLLDDVYREAPAPRVPVVDTVGAGDAFVAALGYGVLDAWTVSEVLAVANELGSFVASRPGAIPEWSRADLLGTS